jgi:hypothetical protein
MAVTKASTEGGGEVSFNTSPKHPDEVVVPVKEVPSALVAEAVLRHETAQTDLATPQEKKQAAVEQAHALSTRPDGSYAQLHETAEPTLAVADEGHLAALRQDQEAAVAKLKGETDEVPASVVRDTSDQPTRDDAGRPSAGAQAQGKADKPK